MRKRSNQRITKIKRDYVEELLKRAEAMDVADAVAIQPPGSDLIPYPDMNNLRLWTRSYLLKGLNKIYPVKIDEDGQTYMTTLVDGLPLFTKMTKSIKVGNDIIETTKPGLWLSNLVQPVSNSAAGSWLRHNLINHYDPEFVDVNADTIGNYSYSFFQRGILKRTAGSTHFNEDSYCQHWSPSALGCISHDAIVIPLNNLRSTYTSYQTLVVPYDPDMQRYNETLSKDVQYNFVDNNNNIPVSITQFNGRVVGKDWSYELVFTPNHSGNTEEPTDSNSTGGCVTGTIVYYDPATDITCTQNINSCFETLQGFFNDDIDHVNSSQLLNTDKDNDVRSCTARVLAGVPQCPSCIISEPCYVKVSMTGVEGSVWYPINLYLIDGGWTETTSGKVYPGCTQAGNCGFQATFVSGGPGCWDGYCSCFLGSTTGTAHYTFSKNNPQVPETNVNIYMNIKDNKAEFEANGLPWTGNCSEPRFEISYSQTPCENNYCTSRLIASNVDIATDGFISNLVSIQLNG